MSEVKPDIRVLKFGNCIEGRCMFAEDTDGYFNRHNRTENYFLEFRCLHPAHYEIMRYVQKKQRFANCPKQSVLWTFEGEGMNGEYENHEAIEIPAIEKGENNE